MPHYPPSTFEGSDETLLNSGQVRQFFGDVSEMWIHRRERDGSGFPRARRIANRKYWLLGELKRWRDAAPRFRVVDAQQSREGAKIATATTPANSTTASE
jgi:hypothetical protein